jgi:hypothetical protein
MANSKDLFPSSCASSQKARILPAKISAVELIEQKDSRVWSGVVRQLPHNALVEICGEGFDERTVKVRWRDSFYFVFRQDLEEDA